MNPHAHLAKIISDAKHPVPCMTAPACEALAAYLLSRFEALTNERTLRDMLAITTPVDTSIFDK